MDPVSTEEFQRAVGELRRRGDERHVENLDRFKSLELEFRAHAQSDLLAITAINRELAQNTELTKTAIVVATETKDSVKHVVELMMAATIGRKVLLSIAGIAIAVSSIWAAILYIIDKGPIPPFHGG